METLKAILSNNAYHDLVEVIGNNGYGPLILLCAPFFFSRNQYQVTLLYENSFFFLPQKKKENKKKTKCTCTLIYVSVHYERKSWKHQKKNLPIVVKMVDVKKTACT